MMTLYADLLQRTGLQSIKPGSISTKTVDGKKYLYAIEKDGKARVCRFLGPAESAAAQDEARLIRRAEIEAKEMRTTVAALKRARIPAPTVELGRVLEAIANAGLFRMGMVLVGTAAFGLYPCVVGAYLSTAAMTTQDVDLSVASFSAGTETRDFEAILKRADPTFEPHWNVEDKLPRTFRAANGFTVDLVTRYGRGRKSPVPIGNLACSAAALSFQEYLVEEAIEVVALYGRGVLVKVPSPFRYAVHKLIVMQRRKRFDPKKQKDLMQAQDLIDIFMANDEAALRDALAEARKRGRAWKTAIEASLKDIGRDRRA